MDKRMRSVASLRVFGDAVDPDEITRSLGRDPTHARRKGDKLSKTAIARTGSWRLEASERKPEDLNGQILELLSSLTSDVEVWTSLAKKFRVDLFVGLFMAKSNEVVVLSPEALNALGIRGIVLGLDIYDEDSRAEEEPQR